MNSKPIENKTKENKPIISINNIYRYPSVLKKNYINKKLNINKDTKDTEFINSIPLQFINVHSNVDSFLTKTGDLDIGITSDTSTDTSYDTNSDSSSDSYLDLEMGQKKVNMPTSSPPNTERCDLYCTDEQVGNCFKSIEEIIISTFEYIETFFKGIFNVKQNSNNKYEDNV